MHELSIASAILESVLDFAAEHSVAKVLAVKLAIGETSHVEAEQLRFCYQAIAEGTLLEGSVLEIETVETIVKCNRCSYRGRPKYWEDALSVGPIPTLQCPDCAAAVEVVAGNDCAIRAVRFATESDGVAIPAT